MAAASAAYVLVARPVERSGLHSFEYALPNYLIPSIVGYSACVVIMLLAPESADRKATAIAGASTGGILQFVIAIGMVVFA